MSQTALGLVMLAGLAVAVPTTMIVLSWWFGRPKSRSRTDMTPYECGKKPFEEAQHQGFSVKFYIVAMLFIIFDIEAAFLYPWALKLKESGDVVGAGFVLGEMLVFLAIVVAGYAYVWGRGALEWDR
jgi:NADH-quinone oxidoreductase subunit A